MTLGRRAAAAAVLLAALGLYYWLDTGRTTWAVPEPAAGVTKLTVELAGARIELERSQASWRAISPAAVAPERSGPGYRGLASPQSGEVPARVDWVLGQLCRHDFPTLPASEVSGPAFGLDPPALRLTIVGARTYHLAIGGTNPARDSRYFRLEEPARAGLLPRALVGEIAALAGGGPEH
ncbi:MAG: hypothetical protein HY816_11065 [Candidatus Wallbacteria bacterium]|nr:hypothetical protein [Candidatus Wallbacteria bacterium]